MKEGEEWVWIGFQMGPTVKLAVGTKWISAIEWFQSKFDCYLLVQVDNGQILIVMLDTQVVLLVTIAICIYRMVLGGPCFGWLSDRYV